MNILLTNQFISYYLAGFIYEFIVYLVTCHSFKLKISKRKAYLMAFLISIFPPLVNTICSLYIGGGFLQETSNILLLNKSIMILEQLFVLVFVVFVLDIVWYRSYWLTMVLHISFILPYQLIYYHKFTAVNSDYEFVIHSVTLETLPNYLFALFMIIALGYVFYLLIQNVNILKRVNQISKWSWFILYFVFLIILLISGRSYQFHPDDNTGILRGADNDKQVLFLIAVIVIVMLVSINNADKRLLKVENKLLKEQNEIQFANYLTMQQQEIKIHKLYHDIGNHIKTIQILVDNGETQEAKEYTENLAQEYQNIKKDFYCNNRIINAVLTQKLIVCDQNKISHELDIQIPESLSILDIDLMSVFSNLMDNAIEGCQQSDNAKNYIKVKTSVIGNYFAVKIINSKSSNVAALKSKTIFYTWKEDKSMHGYGTRILEEIVGRYDGYKELLDQGKEFSAMIMLKAQ